MRRVRVRSEGAAPVPLGAVLLRNRKARGLVQRTQKGLHHCAGTRALNAVELSERTHIPATRCRQMPSDTAVEDLGAGMHGLWELRDEGSPTPQHVRPRLPSVACSGVLALSAGLPECRDRQRRQDLGAHGRPAARAGAQRCGAAAAAGELREPRAGPLHAPGGSRNARGKMRWARVVVMFRGALSRFHVSPARRREVAAMLFRF